MPVKKIQIDCIPYTCRSVAGEDIEIGAKIGYDGTKLLNYKKGMISVSHAKNPAKRGEQVEYVINCQDWYQKNIQALSYVGM